MRAEQGTHETDEDRFVVMFESTAAEGEDYHFVRTGPSSAFLLGFGAAAGAVLVIAAIQYGLEAMIENQTLPPPPALDQYVPIDQIE